LREFLKFIREEKSKAAISSEKKTVVCEISVSCPDSTSGSFAAQPAHARGLFTGFGVRPQQAKIGFVYTKTLLAKDLRPAKV
jgi:hypothetical protein